MSLKVLFPASGGGKNIKHAAKHIRLARHGCTNRPFYHLVVMMSRRDQHEQPIEQLGTYDPLPNAHGEQLVSINFERIQYWIGEGAELSKPVAHLIGLSGFLPIFPGTYIQAWVKRKKMSENPVEDK